MLISIFLYLKLIKFLGFNCLDLYKGVSNYLVLQCIFSRDYGIWNEDGAVGFRRKHTNIIYIIIAAAVIKHLQNMHKNSKPSKDLMSKTKSLQRGFKVIIPL